MVSDNTSGRDHANALVKFDGQLLDRLGFGEAVGEILLVTGAKEKRRRKLEARVVVALIVAMGLYRHLSIPAVFLEMTSWQWKSGTLGEKPLKAVTDQALIHAKKRLGVDPMALLFQRLAGHIRPKPSFHGFRVWGIDGVRINVPDTPENEAAFGRWKSSKGGQTAFPQMLAVALVSTDRHQIKDIILNHSRDPERPCAEQLIAPLTSSDLVFMDRGFHAVWLFQKFIDKGVPFVCRALTSFKPDVLQRLGEGDYLVRIEARVPIDPSEAHGREQTHRLVQQTMRMLEYEIGTNERVRLLTTLTDPLEYPARELAVFYHERWEVEIVYDELKTHLTAVSGGILDLPLRSKAPEGVLQEAYGVVIAFNIVRAIMGEAAEKQHIAPRFMSFVGSLQVVRLAMPQFEKTKESKIDGLWKQLIRKVGYCQIDRPRRKRSNPRVLRQRILHFPSKKPWHHETKVDFAAILTMKDSASEQRKAA